MLSPSLTRDIAMRSAVSRLRPAGMPASRAPPRSGPGFLCDSPEIRGRWPAPGTRRHPLPRRHNTHLPEPRGIVTKAYQFPLAFHPGAVFTAVCSICPPPRGQRADLRRTALTVPGAASRSARTCTPVRFGTQVAARRVSRLPLLRAARVSGHPESVGRGGGHYRVDTGRRLTPLSPQTSGFRRAPDTQGLNLR